MSRGIAKKAYTYGRRNNMDMVSLSKYVEEAINSYNKMTPDMKLAIKSIVDFKYPEDNLENQSSEEKTNEPNKIESNTTKTSSEQQSLFDIKKLNDITDKMIRGSLKKIYMSGKRLNKDTNEVLEEIKSYLNVLW